MPYTAMKIVQVVIDNEVVFHDVQPIDISNVEALMKVELGREMSRLHDNGYVFSSAVQTPSSYHLIKAYEHGYVCVKLYIEKGTN